MVMSKGICKLVPNGETRVLLHFRDFHSKYVLPCHNIIHEDNMMMLRFDIKPCRHCPARFGLGDLGTAGQWQATGKAVSTRARMPAPLTVPLITK